MADSSRSLSNLVDQNTLVEAVEVLRSGMETTKMVRSGKGSYKEVPDQAERRKSAEILLSFGIGRPATINNSLHLTVPSDSTDKPMTAAEVVERLKNNTDLSRILTVAQNNAATEAERQRVQAKKETEDGAIDI